MERKRVLIYGDSNTHGYRVSDGLRFSQTERWTGICQQIVSEEIEILEEGLNGRTTCVDEAGMEFRNGLQYIQPCIRTHLPLDMICVMLGSNDLKSVFQLTPEEIASQAAKVLAKAREVARSKYPDSLCEYLLISPIEVGRELITGPFGWEFEGELTIAKSKRFAACFAEAARNQDFLFFDAAKYAAAGKIDGLHLDAENHRRLGEAMGRWLLAHYA